MLVVNSRRGAFPLISTLMLTTDGSYNSSTVACPNPPLAVDCGFLVFVCEDFQFLITYIEDLRCLGFADWLGSSFTSFGFLTWGHFIAEYGTLLSAWHFFGIGHLLLPHASLDESAFSMLSLLFSSLLRGL